MEKRIDLSKKLGQPQQFEGNINKKQVKKLFMELLLVGIVCVSLKSKDSHVSVQFFRFLGFIPEWPARPSYNRHWCRPARDIGR